MTILLQGLLVLALASAIVYGIWEARRWGTPQGRETIGPQQRRFRILGLFFLLLALGLWLRGTYLPAPHTRLALAHYLGYWIVTALSVLPLIPLALLDARENIRRALADRRRLRETILGGGGPRHD